MNKTYKLKYQFYGFSFFSNNLFELVIWMLFLKSQGWSLLQISYLQMILNLTQVVFEIPSGYYSDRYGKKICLILSQIFSILFSVSFLFSTNFILIFIGFICQGISLSLISGTDQAILHDHISDENESYVKLIGVYNSIAIISISISSLLGGYLSIYSWKLVFIFSIISRFISLFIISILNIERKHDYEKENKLKMKDVYTFIKEHKFIRIMLLVICIAQATLSILYQYGSIFLGSYGYSNSQISTIFFFTSGLSVVASISIHKILSIFEKNKLIKYSLSITLLMFLLILTKIHWLIPIIFVSINVLFEIWDTTLNSMFHEIISSKMRASLISVSGLITALLMALFSVLIGIADNFISISIIFVSLGMLTMLICLYLFNIWLKSKDKLGCVGKK